MPFLLVIMERQVAAMYEEFFELMHTPFTRDIPADRLYSSRQIDDALGRLTYVADRQLFAVVTADPDVENQRLSGCLKADSQRINICCCICLIRS